MRAYIQWPAVYMSVLATAFENCPDILKVDWEMHYNLTGIRYFCPNIGQFCPDFVR